MIHLRKRALYLVLFSALVLFGISAIGGFLRLNDHQQYITNTQPESGLWHASQLELAYQQVLESLLMTKAGIRAGADEQLSQRVDVLWSRLNLFQENAPDPRSRILLAHRETFDELREALVHIDERMASLQEGDREALTQTYEGLVLMRSRVHQLALDGLRFETSMIADSETRIDEILNRLAIDLIALGLSVAVVVFLLARQINVVELTRREADEAKEALAQAIEGVSEGFALFDASDRLLMANSVYREIYQGDEEDFAAGIQFEDMCRSAVKKGIHADAAGREKEWIARRLAAHLGEAPFEEELSDGRWILARDQRIESGGMVGIRSDITDRKQAELKLRDALSEARIATKAKSEFLAIMSHEMRTPLNGVIGLLGLMLDSKLDPEQRGYVMTARESGEMLLSLIEDVLDFSKIEAGKLELEETAFDPSDLVSGVVEVLAPRAHAKGIEVLSYVDPSVPGHLLGDPGRLRQIIFNLAGNAVKFTERGGVTVELALAAEDGETVVLSGAVTDTGIGIPYEAQETLFAEFIQLDASYSRRFGGTGLGLTITRRLVEAMKGAVWVNSEPGKGSVFSFSVQLKRDPAEAVIAPRKAPVARKILFWSDEGITSDLTIKCLRGDGHKVVNVQTENDAVARLTGSDFDVVMIDCRPQDETGFYLASKLRDLNIDTPVFLLRPGSIQLRNEGELPTDAITGILAKPLQKEMLKSALETLSGEIIQTEQGPTEADQAARTIGAGYRLLLAEDSPTNRMVASVILRRAGFRVDWVKDGVEAVEAIKRLSYDLVLMDISMPNMDGVEATKAIRSLDVAGATVPIIALTAHAMPGDRERFLSAGMDDYLTKPLRGEELLKAISEFCPPKSPEDLSAQEKVEGASVAPSEPLQAPIQAQTVSASPQAASPVLAVSNDTEAKAGPSPKIEMSPVVDEIVFRQLQEDAGPEVVPQLIDVFLNELVGRVSRINEAEPDGDSETIAKEAHALKSSAGSFGATKLHLLAKDVEKAARREERKLLSDLVPQLSDTGEETERQFRLLIK
ncbi:hybrid sensor histidine kinase/response regulator [Aestuariispira insulae]|uniref:Sensory/regulatory protein RpfC n=1 Tax=Aestuariispira insulae TaxID=1461337 RepID=A0A3D9HY65_9PROT|nr:response regulator [Aestuariispira insulae]RED54360.1 response regulator receiver domain-containing protein [Aestuariispira insulae]